MNNSNYIVADSGTTKTDWCLVQNNEVKLSFRTAGFNPFFINTGFIINELNSVFSEKFDAKCIESVFFYGAGCSSPERCNIVSEGLTAVFSKAVISIDTDLIAVARALFPADEGIAVILGTGSNSCYCKNGIILNKFNSLGYVLGDEGSGNHMGKKLLKAYLESCLPPFLHQRFEKAIRMEAPEILDQIYRKPMPNRFLASFSTFIRENITDDFCRYLVIDCFTEFFKHNLCKYPGYQDLTISYSGSIAWNFRQELVHVAQNHKTVTGKIIASPIIGLTNYHKNIF